MNKGRNHKSGNIILKIAFNVRLHRFFYLIFFASILLALISFALILIEFMNPSMKSYLIIGEIFLSVSILGFIPLMAIKGRKEGFRVFYIYMIIFLTISVLKFGDLINDFLIYFATSGQSIPSWIMTQGILNAFNYFIRNGYFFLILGVGALISFILTYLIWGFEFDSYIDDSLIILPFILLGVLLKSFYGPHLFTVSWFILYLVIALIIGTILGKFGKGNIELRTATDIGIAFLLTIIFTGVSPNTIYSLMNWNIYYNAEISTLNNVATLILFIPGTWISILASQTLIKNRSSNKRVSLIANFSIGLTVSLLIIILYGNYLTSFENFSVLIEQPVVLLSAVSILFTISFILTFVISIILGVINVKMDPPFYALIILLAISLYLEIKDSYLPGILLFSSITIGGYLAGATISYPLSMKYSNGKSIMDKKHGTINIVPNNTSNRPPYCWERSKSLESYLVVRALPVKSGFGYVLEGYDPASRRRVAIKILKEASEDGTPIAFDSNTLNRFNEEHEKLKNLKGIKNIVNIYDTHLPEIERYSGPNRLDAYIKSPPYIVMEFLTGGSLSDVGDNFKDPRYVRPFLLIIYAIANGLYEAHSKGIIHGDIKPDNIMFASTGRKSIKTEAVDPEVLEKSILKGYLIPKLTDFGTAKVMNAGIVTFSTATVNYAPPEILVNQNAIDQRYDIYELGMVMYYELAGVISSPEKSLEFNRRQSEIAKLINEGKFYEKLDEIVPHLESIELADIRRLNPGVSDRLWIFIKRTIEPNPSIRPKNMKEFSAAIKAIAISDYDLIDINNF